MLQYGFSEDEISETIASAGYKTGGRVGFRIWWYRCSNR